MILIEVNEKGDYSLKSRVNYFDIYNIKNISGLNEIKRFYNCKERKYIRK